jgi:hypothetical protein
MSTCQKKEKEEEKENISYSTTSKVSTFEVTYKSADR